MRPDTTKGIGEVGMTEHSGMAEVKEKYDTMESYAAALFALIDQDVNDIESHPDIKVEREDEYGADGEISEDAEITRIKFDTYEWDSLDSASEGASEQLGEGYFVNEAQCGFGQPLRLILESGGPGTEIVAVLDGDGDVSEAEFQCTWGYGTRTWHIPKHAALFRVAEWHAEIEWGSQHRVI